MSLAPPLQADTDTRPPQVHLGYLDGMRALAALFVLIHHAYLQAWPEDYGKLPHGVLALTVGWLIYGRIAVDAFLVLSGYCLMIPVARGDGTLRGGALFFFKKRAHRILPTYYLALGLSLLLIWLFVGHKTGTHWDISVPVTAHGLWMHLLLLQDVAIGGRAQINHAYWSISVEWQIYFLFPLLILAWRQIGGLTTTLVTVVLSLAAWKILEYTPFAGITPQYLGLFALGMLGSAISFSPQPIWARWRTRIPWATYTLLGAGIWCLYGLVIKIKHLKFEASTVYNDVIVGIVITSVLITASLNHEGRLHRLLSWRPLAFIGTFAYSIYLIHAPLLQVFTQYLCQPLHLGRLATFLVLAFFATPIIVGFSYLFFLVAERPFLNHRPALKPTPKLVTAE